MKIVHVAPTGGWYGTETVAAQMASHLAVRGHDVAFVWRSGRGFAPGLARAALDERVSLVLHPEDVDNLAEWTWRHLPFSPDLFHAHLGPGSRLAAELADGRVPWVGSMHIRFFWSHFGTSDAVIAVSPWQLRDVPPRYGGRKFLVPNFLASRPPVPARVVDSMRRRLYADDDTFIVGGVGRLHIEKGFDVLCRAFMEARLPNARLIILGEGEERTMLSRFAERCPDIILMGYVENAWRLMNGFDLFVSASRAESFGMSLLEAMQLGLPVLATAALGPIDLLGADSERLLPLGDVGAMATALRHAYERRERRIEYSLTAYRPEAAMDRLVDAYERTIEQFTPRKAPGARPKGVAGRVASLLRRTW